MSISVNQLFNRLVQASDASANAGGSGSRNFGVSTEWAPVRNLIHENPHVLDELFYKIARHGNPELNSTFVDLMRSLTSTMQCHPYMKKNPGLVLAFTTHVMHTKGVTIGSLREVKDELEGQLSALIGVRKEQFRLSPRVHHAGVTYGYTPQQAYQTVCGALSEIDGPGNFRERNTAFNVPPIAEQKVVVQEYVTFAHVQLSKTSPDAQTILRNATRSLPHHFAPLGLAVESQGSVAAATVAFNFFSVGTPHRVLHSALYTNTLLRVLPACYAVIEGVDKAMTRTTAANGKLIADALVKTLVCGRFVIDEESGAPAVRLTVMDRESRKIYGGVLVTGLIEPFGLMHRLGEYFGSRLNYGPVITQSIAVKDEPPGIVRFYSPDTESWEIVPAVVRLEA